MLSKYFTLMVPLLSLGGNTIEKESKKSLNASIYKKIRSEIVSSYFMILMGGVLFSITFIALYFLGKSYQQYLQQFKYESAIEMASFGFLALIGASIIFIIFRSSRKKATSLKIDIKESLDPVVLQELGFSFLEGFIENFDIHKKSVTQNNDLAKNH